MNPHHIRENRSSTADEVEKDSLTLARIRNMFPSTAEIQKMSPHGICETIPQWLPFIEEAKTACVTDEGAEAFRRAGEFLSEIKDLGPADTTIKAADRAFARLIEISLALRDEAREIATKT
jgi:hypothetical protein